MSNDLRFRATMEDKVSSALDRIKDKATLTGKQSAAMGVGIAVGQKAFGLLEGAIGGAVDKVGEFIQKAEEEQVVSARLDQALAANVKGWDGNREAINKYIEEQTNLGFTNAETTASMAQLVAATGDVAKAETFLSAAEDLARLKGISLAEATDALTKVEGGSYRILKSLGIELAKGATQTQALAAVQKISAGQAEKYGTTTAGAIAKMNAKFDEAQVKIGEKLLPALTKLAIALADIAGPAGDAATAIVDAPARALELLHIFEASIPKYGAVSTGFSGISKEVGTVIKAFQNVEVTVPTKAVRDLTEAVYYDAVAMDKAAPKVRDYFHEFERSRKGTAGDVAQARIDILDAAQAVKDAQKAMEKATPGTAAYRRAQLELAVAQGTLADNTQTLNDKLSTAYQLHPTEKTRKELIKYFDSIGLAVLGLSGDALAAYDALNPLLKLSIPQTLINQKGTKPTGGKHPGAHASGGWVGLDGPELSWVGEKGPEYIVPNNKLGQGMGGVTVNASFLAMPTPGQVQQLVAMIDEALYFGGSRSSASATRK